MFVALLLGDEADWWKDEKPPTDILSNNIYCNGGGGRSVFLFLSHVFPTRSAGRGRVSLCLTDTWLHGFWGALIDRTQDECDLEMVLFTV